MRTLDQESRLFPLRLVLGDFFKIDKVKPILSYKTGD
jgi:hypothetical protein